MAEKYLLKDKVSIVTGAGAGIGRATAEEFAKEGAKVMIAELREERGIQAAREIAEATARRCAPAAPTYARRRRSFTASRRRSRPSAVSTS